jgi:hypothetical protein
LTFEQLHHLVASAADRRLSRAFPVYELRSGWLPLSRRSRTLGERQQRVLSALRALGWPVFVRISESPLGLELPGSWGHAARDTWAVPREIDSAELLGSLLTPGGWQLYVALEAVDPSALPDLFRGELAEAYTSVEALGVPGLVDAFHDNAEWRVLLQPAAAARRAAA